MKIHTLGLAIPIFLQFQPHSMPLDVQKVPQTVTTANYQVLFLHYEDAMMSMMSDLLSMPQKLMTA